MSPTCEREWSCKSASALATAEPSRATLHVLTLTPFFPSAEDAVEGCFIAEVLPALQGRGIRNSVIAVRPFYRGRCHPASQDDFARRLRYFSLPSWPGLASSGTFLFARMLPEVCRLHAVHAIDLIHAHAALPAGHAAALLSRRLRIPFVVSVHGRDAYSARQVPGPARSWCRRVSSGVYRSAQRVICVSDAVRREVNSVLPQAYCSVVYNGVDESLFPSGANFPRQAATVLAVGNLIASKGHDSLLHAIAALRFEFPELHCEIIGTGSARSALFKLAENLGIGSRVHFLGRVSRQEVADAYRRCSIFVLPSTYEALGCVYLEAMASARPVIGCRGQGIAELIEDGGNGFLVDPDSPNQIASLLRSLLRDNNLSCRTGMAARRTIIERFTLRHQADRLAQIFWECAQ